MAPVIAANEPQLERIAHQVPTTQLTQAGFRCCRLIPPGLIVASGRTISELAPAPRAEFSNELLTQDGRPALHFF